MPAALAIPAIIGAAGSIGGALISSHASNKAADIQSQNANNVAAMLQQYMQSGQAGVADATGKAQDLITYGQNAANTIIGTGTNNANQTLSDIYNQEYGNLSPYLSAGANGIQALQTAVGPGGSLNGVFQAPTAAEARATPGYQFTADQGTQAIMRNAAASGISGGSLKSLDQYNTGLASQYYQQAYNNSLNTFNTNRTAQMQNIMAQLGLGQFGTTAFNQAGQNYGDRASANTMQGGLAQAGNVFNASQYAGTIGLTGAQDIAQLGMQGGNTIANALTGGANARAAGTVGSANAWNSALGGITNAAQYAGLMSTLGGIGGGGGVTGAMPPGYTQPSVAPPPSTLWQSSYSLPGGQY